MHRGYSYRLFAFWFIVVFLLLNATLSAADENIQLVSRSSAGQIGDQSSYPSSISADGRFVAFRSIATNLVAGDTNATSDVFVRDMQTGQTTRVSVDSSGQQGNGLSSTEAPVISADGRFVAFNSLATNLVSNDTNGLRDVFLHDRQTGQTIRVSVNSAGQQADGQSGAAGISISSDGRFVAFQSVATNLDAVVTVSSHVFLYDRITGQTTRVSVDSSNVPLENYSNIAPSISADGRFIAFTSSPNSLGGWDHINVRDRQMGQTTEVSVSSGGQPGNDTSSRPSISANGRFVAFVSSADNLVPNDTTSCRVSQTTFVNCPDIFVHDLQTGQTILVSVNSAGQQSNDFSDKPSLSSDGRFVAFSSTANNLISGDPKYWSNIYVHDTWTGQTGRVSITANGQYANEFSYDPLISSDGSFITFDSFASNLVSGDTNGAFDVFVSKNVLLISPPNAAPLRNYYTALPFTLTWMPLNWAIGYQVQVATANTFLPASIVLDTSVVTNTPRLGNINLNNGIYFWRVRAQLDSTHWGAWSTIDTFKVER